MDDNNIEMIRHGLEILRIGLRSFVLEALTDEYGDSWSLDGVEHVLPPSHVLAGQASVQTAGEQLLGLDIQTLLTVIEDQWHELFAPSLDRVTRRYVIELKGICIHLAYQRTMSSEDTLRSLDIMQRLLRKIGGQAAAAELSPVIRLTSQPLSPTLPPASRPTSESLLAPVPSQQCRSHLTESEAIAIRRLLRPNQGADHPHQKQLRGAPRALGFYISDYGISPGGFTEHTFDQLISSGHIAIDAQ